MDLNGAEVVASPVPLDVVVPMALNLKGEEAPARPELRAEAETCLEFCLELRAEASTPALATTLKLV
jgi:hypothetical protein